MEHEIIEAIEPWDSNLCRQVEMLLSRFCTKEEVAAMTDTPIEDIDYQCSISFNGGVYGHQPTFEKVRDVCSARGRAYLRETLFDMATNERDTKALDMLARSQLELGAVEIRKKNAQPVVDEDQEDTIEVDFIADLQNRREARKPRADV